MYHVEIVVTRREFEPGKKRSHALEFDVQLQIETPSKYNLFINCCRQFGRCAGRIPMGWRFERIERFDDGSRRWVEYHVTVVAGGQPDPGFCLVHTEDTP